MPKLLCSRGKGKQKKKKLHGIKTNVKIGKIWLTIPANNNALLMSSAYFVVRRFLDCAIWVVSARMHTSVYANAYNTISDVEPTNLLYFFVVEFLQVCAYLYSFVQVTN